MADTNCSSIIDSLLKGMDGIISSKTVMGEPTKIDDTIILPLMDVSFGVGAGASENKNDKNNGGGGGLTGKVSPSAVLVIKDGYTKLVNIKNQDAVTKVLDLIPDVFDKVSGLLGKKDMPTDNEAVSQAFPEENE